MNKKIMTKTIIALTIIGSITILSLFVVNKPTVTSIKSDALLVKMTKEELLKESDAVVIGDVQNKQSFKSSSEFRPGKKDILSNVTLQVNEYLYNPKNFTFPQITIHALGGNIEGSSMTVSEAPIFEIGEKVIVFLKQINGQTFNVIGWAQGKYTVINNTVGKGDEKIYIKNIFGRDLSVDDFKKEINVK